MSPFLVAVLVAGSVCAGSADKEPPVDALDDVFAPLEFLGSGTTPNDRCPVRRRELNPDMAPVFVNGRPIGFC